jgi:heterotetrameric sarcosine oxidase delta subunit
MLLIPCPHCGLRDLTEFTYSGDASVTRPPAPEDVDDAAWIEYLYMRTNNKGPHEELWQHTHGCRQLVRVCRDVTNHEVVVEDPS